MAEKSKPDIWMPLYVADYQADTAYLTTEQSGAYLHLLMAYWRNGPPPDNDAILASITRLPPDAWSNARAVLVHYFEVCDGYWINKRVEQELDKAKANRAKAHDRAVAAAKARWAREKMPEAMLGALPEDMLVQCPSPSPIQSQAKAKEQEPAADAPVPAAKEKAKRPKSQETTLTDWLTALEEKPAIAEDDPLLLELDAAGVPGEYVSLAWRVFKRDWSTKTAKDWPATFRNAIRKGWVRLWYFDQVTGECRLNSNGELARRTLPNDD